MKKKQYKKIFWGVLFLLGAIALLLGRFGYLEGLNFWSVFFSIVLFGLLADGILGRSFGQILFSLACLIILNDELLHLEMITPWPVLGAALLGTIGLNILFPKRWKYKNHPIPPYPPNGCRPGKKEEEILSGEEIRYEASFGYAVKYVVGSNIGRIFLESSFGNLEVYFTDASLKDNTAHALVECSFGNLELYVPADWNVVINVGQAFGRVEESGCGNPSGVNTLYLEGEVSFGHVEVHHI